MIVGEANAEARRILREAIAEKEALLGEVRKIRSLLRSALEVVDTVPSERAGDSSARPAEVTPTDETTTTEPGIRRIAG